MGERRFEVPKISCGHCTATIQRELGEVEGVTAVAADPETRMVTVRWQEPADWDEIREVLADIGYPPAEG